MFKGDEPIPTFVMVIFGIVYNVIGAGIMMCFEKWSFMKASYFTFVSLMTIGFGDVVPCGDEQNYQTAIGIVCGSEHARITHVRVAGKSDGEQCIHHNWTGRSWCMRACDYC
jgi:hypothetical protein